MEIDASIGHVQATVKVTRKLTPQELQKFKDEIHDEMVEEWVGSDDEIGGTTYAIEFTGLDADGIEFFKDPKNTIEGANNEEYHVNGGTFTIDYFVES